MDRHASRRNSLLSLLVVSSLLLTQHPVSVFAKDRKPVVVSFGQPNIWSLEQAHYLLARMHMANLDLQAKALEDDDLDPNATHGSRVRILRQLLQVGAQFDQTKLFQNRRVVDQAQFNDNRRRELIARRDTRADDVSTVRRERAKLEIERARMNTDTTATDESKALKDKEIEKKTEELEDLQEKISQIDKEMATLGPAATETPTAPDASTAPGDGGTVPDSVLSKLSESDLRDLLTPGKDPSLNATTKLDNTVQLQYEIIAKQLTLLRDEVGPGERLVFLELPQSIYTTPGTGDEKMAQSWWHVNGYTRVDPLMRLLLELYDVERKWHDIQLVPAFRAFSPGFRPCPSASPIQSPSPDDAFATDRANENLRRTFEALREEHATARIRIIDRLFREANLGFDRVEQNGARDTSDTIDAIRNRLFIRSTESTSDKSGTARQQSVEVKTGQQTMTATDNSDRIAEEVERAKIEQLKWELLNLLSPEEPFNRNQDRICDKDRYSLDKGIEFVRLSEQYTKIKGLRDIERRTVRAVDIIPRQSSLNVNDIQNTVKATGILAGFKFLFGFAGQVNFQRQREQFEQFVHQELYASGFGKGNHDFGWTFGALPGTNRVAPGVRTTYAVLVVPDTADSLVLSARGCYFPRKSYQPLDFADTGDGDWNVPDKFKTSNCGDEQTYLLPIPGGGNTSNFWVTHIDYQNGHSDGDSVTVSVRGRNFSSQMGVLINGVALFPTVGLAHPHLMPKKGGGANGAAQPATSECNGGQTICGRYERVDSQQIVFSFRMPDGFQGIPTITLVAPGKSVDLNTTPNLRINRRSNLLLRDDGDFMFGKRPPPFALDNVELLNAGSSSASAEALVSGRGFLSTDVFYVNGHAVTSQF
jgi:hypothetical protein